jgi:hypothetical protein
MHFIVNKKHLKLEKDLFLTKYLGDREKLL